MPSNSPHGALRDILLNIELARSFVAGLSFDQFRTDRRTVYAATRCLEIISEASRKLPEDLKARHPHIPWVDIAAAGNVYRHDYEDVLDRIVWRTVHESLQQLKMAADAEIEKLEKK
jgi:uncharacterized protein with HEPN domain